MGKKIRRILMVVLLLIFVGSIGVMGYRKWQDKVSGTLYSQASEQYTTVKETDTEAAETLLAPIEVDFDALLAENADVVGWIYCEDTPIDYLVVQGMDNDQYLRHSYDGAYSTAGTIFIDANNRSNLTDCNTIVYGHNMRNGSMFAVLSSWADQTFYEEHPILWFLTPEQDYEVVVMGGYTTSAYSDETYTIYQEPCEEFDHYIQAVLAESDIETGVMPEEGAHYLVLSTCSYVFDDARYVLLGKLVPAGVRQ